MGGVCPSKPAFERVASPPSRPAAQKSGGPNFGVDEYEDTSFRRGVPVAEVEEGSVRRGEQYNSDGTVSGLSSKRGKLNVWTLGYNSGSFVEAGEFSVSKQSFRPTLPTPTAPDPTRASPPDFDDLKFLRTLGVGSFGRVALVEHVPSQQPFAIKRLTRGYISKYGHQETARRERELLGAVDSPFLARMVASYSGETNLFLLMEWCRGGELLLQLERQPEERLSPERVAFYVGGVACGIRYLHKRGIVFRGVKPENVMIAADGYPVLIDFGFAKNIGVDGRTYTLVGSPDYIAPEILMREKRDKGYGTMVDYWSLGCLTYELLMGVPPFSNNVDDYKPKIYADILKRARDKVKLKWRGPIPLTAKNFVDLLLVGEPDERLGSKSFKVEFTHHPFMDMACGGKWADLKERVLPAPPLNRGDAIYTDASHTIDASFFEPQLENSKVMCVGKFGWSAVGDFEHRSGRNGSQEVTMKRTPSTEIFEKASAEPTAAVDEMAKLEAEWDGMYGVPVSEQELLQPMQNMHDSMMFDSHLDTIVIEEVNPILDAGVEEAVSQVPANSGRSVRRSLDGDLQDLRKSFEKEGRRISLTSHEEQKVHQQSEGSGPGGCAKGMMGLTEATAAMERIATLPRVEVEMAADADAGKDFVDEDNVEAVFSEAGALAAALEAEVSNEVLNMAAGRKSNE